MISPVPLWLEDSFVVAWTDKGIFIISASGPVLVQRNGVPGKTEARNLKPEDVITIPSLLTYARVLSIQREPVVVLPLNTDVEVYK